MLRPDEVITVADSPGGATRLAGCGGVEPSVELVIFDCDGVLVDSERMANTIFAELITAAGLPTTLEDSVRLYLGRSVPASVALIEGELGHRLPDDFVATYYERIYAAFDLALEPVEGVVAALDALEALGVATCVASSGTHEKMRRTLGRTGLLERFRGRISSASDVARGKPFPDLFLHAAERMAADPARCTVVEDSPAGVEAGAAAGMTVLGYAGLVHPLLLERAGATVFTSMGELPRLVTGAAPSSGTPTRRSVGRRTPSRATPGSDPPRRATPTRATPSRARPPTGP
jgi:HAD superfamily hydrolase (TIGR01509 family)